MMIYSKPCVLDPWDVLYISNSRGTIGSHQTPKPIPKDKGEFIKEDDFKV